jgi:hypothetical protein
MIQIATGAGSDLQLGQPRQPPLANRLATDCPGAAHGSRALERGSGHPQQPLRLRAGLRPVDRGHSTRRTRSQRLPPHADVAPRPRHPRRLPHSRNRGARVGLVGPGAQSHLGERVVSRLLAGRGVTVIRSADSQHTWTTTDHVPRLLVIVTLHERAWSRPWHVPCNLPWPHREGVGDLCRGAGLQPVKVKEYASMFIRTMDRQPDDAGAPRGGVPGGRTLSCSTPLARSGLSGSRRRRGMTSWQPSSRASGDSCRRGSRVWLWVGASRGYIQDMAKSYNV